MDDEKLVILSNIHCVKIGFPIKSDVMRIIFTGTSCDDKIDINEVPCSSGSAKM